MGQIYSGCTHYISPEPTFTVEYRVETQLDASDSGISYRTITHHVNIPDPAKASFLTLRDFLFNLYELEASVENRQNFRLFTKVGDTIVPVKAIVYNNFSDIDTMLENTDLLIFTTNQKRKVRPPNGEEGKKKD